MHLKILQNDINFHFGKAGYRNRVSPNEWDYADVRMGREREDLH